MPRVVAVSPCERPRTALIERATLSRHDRLRGREAIQALFRSGARLEREAFLLVWMHGTGRRCAAFAAGRRLGGSATRNRARRRLREAYRRQKHRLPENGVRVCFVARRRALGMRFGALCEEVSRALAQLAARLGG